MQRTLAVLLTLMLLPVSLMAQSRRRSTTTKPSTAATSTTSDLRRQGAQRVADQIKTLTKFIYILGGVASGFASVDEAARRNEASPTVIEQTKQSKAAVRSNIQSVREGLDKLEIQFRTTPELQRYYIKLAGVAAGAASAEDLAAANQFDAAGRKLLDVINRLTDVLLEMR